MHSISFMNAYSGKSFEELRAEDYHHDNKGALQKRDSLFWQIGTPPTPTFSLKDSSNLPTAFVPTAFPSPAPIVSMYLQEEEQKDTAQREELVRELVRLTAEVESLASSEVFAIHSLLYRIHALTAPYGLTSQSDTQMQSKPITQPPTPAPSMANGIPIEIANANTDAEGFFSNKRYYILGKFVSFVEDVMHEFKVILSIYYHC